jgi:uncharacterized membrane protein
MRLLGLLILGLLSAAIAIYAVAVYSLLPLGTGLSPEMKANFIANRPFIYTHIFASAVALMLGPFQFSTALRRRFTRLHRWSGRAYLGIGVLFGGLCALYMSAHAFGGAVAKLGFAGLAVCWLYTGLQAFLAIRRSSVDEHRKWMVRNFSLTFAAVTLRIYIPASVMAGIPFEVAYPVIAWVSWVPNLLVAELAFNARRKSLTPSPLRGPG